MKILIILSLVVSQNLFSKTQIVNEDAAVTSAAGLVGRIEGVVADAVRPGTTCTEEVVDLPRGVKVKDSPLKVIVCRPDAASLTVPTGEDYSQLIRDYKIEFHPNEAAITGTRDWRLFVHELRKFPPALMTEMAAKGGKIRVMIGNGVSEDPQWQVEKQRAINIAQRYWDWYYHPSTTAKAKENRPVPISPAQAGNGFDVTTEGARQWDVVSGAGGVFSNPDAISPTRIVLNRMYYSAHREPNGTISSDRMQGATNLFLHEHGHAMDNLYGAHSISRSDEWRAVMADSQVKAFLPHIFSEDYELKHDEEGFAEAFSYYHSCEASRKQMEEQAPALAEYFRTFSVEKLRALKPTP